MLYNLSLFFIVIGWMSAAPQTLIFVARRFVRCTIPPVIPICVLTTKRIVVARFFSVNGTVRKTMVCRAV